MESRLAVDRERRVSRADNPFVSILRLGLVLCGELLLQCRRNESHVSLLNHRDGSAGLLRHRNGIDAVHLQAANASRATASPLFQ